MLCSVPSGARATSAEHQSSRDCCSEVVARCVPTRRAPSRRPHSTKRWFMSESPTSATRRLRSQGVSSSSSLVAPSHVRSRGGGTDAAAPTRRGQQRLSVRPGRWSSSERRYGTGHEAASPASPASPPAAADGAVPSSSQVHAVSTQSRWLSPPRLCSLCVYCPLRWRPLRGSCGCAGAGASLRRGAESSACSCAFQTSDPLGASNRTRRAPWVLLAHPSAPWAAEAANVRVGARARGRAHHVGQRRAHVTRRAGAVGQRRIGPPPRVAVQQRRGELTLAAGVPASPNEVPLGHAAHDDARAASRIGGAPQRGPIVLEHGGIGGHVEQLRLIPVARAHDQHLRGERERRPQAAVDLVERQPPRPLGDEELAGREGEGEAVAGADDGPRVGAVVPLREPGLPPQQARERDKLLPHDRVADERDGRVGVRAREGGRVECGCRPRRRPLPPATFCWVPRPAEQPFGPCGVAPPASPRLRVGQLRERTVEIASVAVGLERGPQRRMFGHLGRLCRTLGLGRAQVGRSAGSHADDRGEHSDRQAARRALDRCPQTAVHGGGALLHQLRDRRSRRDTAGSFATTARREARR
eukprot:scaffold2790_cov56-Phaeocystis_antarctica.AAC.2